MVLTTENLQEQFNQTMNEWESLRLMSRDKLTIVRMKKLGVLAIEIQRRIGLRLFVTKPERS